MIKIVNSSLIKDFKAQIEELSYCNKQLQEELSNHVKMIGEILKNQPPPVEEPFVDTHLDSIKFKDGEDTMKVKPYSDNSFFFTIENMADIASIVLSEKEAKQLIDFLNK